MVTATQSLTDDMIELFAAEIGAQIKLVDAGEEKEALLRAKYFSDEDSQDMASAVPRPPIVTVMGHVDHGKTLLLDKIRHSNTVAGEAGGITQHIGAYQVQVGDQRITFIDTPGHEAFTAMRARGAQVTDIVVLVVAADDGVMPQTVEAIDHARSAQVPIVVAINKIDKAGADIDRVLHQLAEHGLLAEKWGGDTITVEISALTGEGINDLLEHLLLVAELEELKATPEGRARGVVLEANLEVGRGPVATVIVQQGTLRVGDPLVAGAAWGKVKALVNDKGEMVKEALPSTPVEVLGWSEPPIAGEEFRVTADLSVARTIGETRAQRGRFMLAGQGTSVSPGAKLEDIFEQIQRGETATLNLILKADVQGSLEAVSESLRKLEREGIKLTFVHRGVGAITENDVQLASVSNATVIGFNVRPDRRARELANERSVEIRTYEVIYKLVEDMEAAMAGMLAPSMEEVVTGEAEVRAVFRVPRVGAVAGCYVRSGTITRGSKVRFLRDGVVIWKGTITSLKRFKDDVREVATGFECGIGLSDYQDLKEGDIIETFEEREREST
jgi:translation initiation factor IF-2